MHYFISAFSMKKANYTKAKTNERICKGVGDVVNRRLKNSFLHSCLVSGVWTFVRMF